MKTLVHQARAAGNTHRTGARWPFELTQNAHDPGVRQELSAVGISLSFDGQVLTYEHDGKPFTYQELAALLSGGSSKEFESAETTGRFGTGFLVTHVLSPRVDVECLLATEAGHEAVSIQLDRGGSEDDILKNTSQGHEAISGASSVEQLEGRATARFRYHVDNADAADVGLNSFRSVVPYLYGTCEHLGSVYINQPGGKWQRFEPADPVEREFCGHHLRVRRFTLTQQDTNSTEFVTIRLRKQLASKSSLVVVLESIGEKLRLVLPSPQFPKLFCRFPIGGSDFLPTNAIIDGRFELDQERGHLLMTDSDKEQLTDSLALLPVMLQLATNEAWADGFRLARVGLPGHFFGDDLNAKPQEELKKWLQTTLTGVARSVSEMKIVQTPAGPMNATGSPPCATFIVPSFSLESAASELEIDAVWDVAKEIYDVHPPLREIADAWKQITSEWTALGLKVQRAALPDIAKAARDKAKTLDQLRVSTEPLSWLVRFLELVGQLPGQHNRAVILTDLLPCQSRELKSPKSLCRGIGINEQLKGIAASIGRDVRSRLLLGDVEKHCDDKAFPHLRNLVESEVTQTLSEAAVLKECVEELNKELPIGKAINETKNNLLNASIELLAYLWQTQGDAAAVMAQQVPLAAADNSSVRWSLQSRVLAPVSLWHNDAQPFSGLYLGHQILGPQYAVSEEGKPRIVDALVKWGIAFADPLYVDEGAEIKDARLQEISLETPSAANTAVKVAVSQIAHLPTQLIQRCQTDPELARKLLGLVLRYVAPNDPFWRNPCVAENKKGSLVPKVRVLPALWLADLRFKAWVPMTGDADGKRRLFPMLADAATLKSLLDPSWLTGNRAAVDLLCKYFGFRPLELLLLGAVPKDGERGQIEDQLAELIQQVGYNAADYRRIIDDVVNQRIREAAKAKNRRFGIAVQEAIESYLDKSGLHPKLVDQGYDYGLFVDEATALEAGTHHFALADYLLEVKATTTGEVRLTPAQAKTSSENAGRFILCVVDLRGISPERMDLDWARSDVEPRARIVTNIGTLAGESHQLVRQATSCPVGIRNEIALRYGVPVVVWETGVTIAEWVNGLSLKSPVPSEASNGD